MLWKQFCTLKKPLLYLVMQFQVATFVYEPFKPPHLLAVANYYDTRFAIIWCTSPIFGMELMHTTFALRSISEQRFVCDCLVHAARLFTACINFLVFFLLLHLGAVPRQS